MRHFARTLFGTAVVAALGLGAAQGFAAPAGAAAAGTARTCGPTPTFCNDYCVGEGYSGGSCVSNSGGGKKCFCF